MTTVRDFWGRIYVYTGNASDRTRTTAIAGLAAVWLFSGGGDGDLTRIGNTPTGFLLAGALFASCLAFDLLHYSISAIAYRIWLRRQERGGKAMDDEIDPPLPLLGVPRWLFYGKIVILFAGYVAFAYVIWTAYADSLATS
jgi:hypothetical protein